MVAPGPPLGQGVDGDRNPSRAYARTRDIGCMTR